jgi:valyl-tRNA synthetase
MAKQFSFRDAEKKILDFWKKEKIYKFDSKNKKKVYSIDTPPPYLSGKMHIGHAASYSQQDFIARFRRMFDGNVFYPFGTDDNGLPTERFVEKTKNIKSKDMSRAKFIELCLKTLKEMTPEFIQDYRDMGISCDFDIYYSTIDKHSQKISQKSFIDLYNQNDIYRKAFPTLWCTDCQTSIAQAELEDKEEDSLFTTLKFKSDGKDLSIATTRPELLPACVAVFVNPKDKRYKKLIGRKAKVPLSDHEVPILADSSAEMEKGTGVLMVCSYGDKYDADAIKRHNLKARIIIGEDGKINFGKYKNLNVKATRKEILKDLKEANLITDQKQIKHIVNVHDRCGTPIEFLTTEQWFIKVLDYKKDLIKQGKAVKWHPEFMYKRYENWVKGLEWDWSISRERHYGVPIPVWECKKCNEIILPKEKDLPVDPLQIKKKCKKCGEYAQGEPRVLDTWATSSVTPQIADALVKDKIGLPFSLRPQAHDIIRTWAFYTILKSYLHEKKIPWENIIVSGYITLGGKKMSKSKETGIQPRDLLEEYGADAIRFWAAGSKLGSDMGYQEKDLVTGKKFVNKLKNAAKFVFMNLEDYDGKKPKRVGTDIEFEKEIRHLIKNVTGSFDRYNYSVAKSRTEDFFWRYFTFYIELVKGRIYNEKGDKKLSAQYTLYQSLLTILKLMAPIMPFITEDIYQEHLGKFEKEKSIHISEWPKLKKDTQPSSYLRMGESIYSMINQERTKNKKSMNSEIILTLTKKNIRALEDSEMMQDFKNMVHAKEIKTGKFKVEFI